MNVKLLGVASVVCAMLTNYCNAQVDIEMRKNNEYFVKYNNQSKSFKNISEFNFGIEKFTNGYFGCQANIINDKTILFYVQPSKNNNIYELVLTNKTDWKPDRIFIGGQNTFTKSKIENFNSGTMYDTLLDGDCEFKVGK